MLLGFVLASLILLVLFVQAEAKHTCNNIDPVDGDPCDLTVSGVTAGQVGSPSLPIASTDATQYLSRTKVIIRAWDNQQCTYVDKRKDPCSTPAFDTTPNCDFVQTWFEYIPSGTDYFTTKHSWYHTAGLVVPASDKFFTSLSGNQSTYEYWIGAYITPPPGCSYVLPIEEDF